VVARALELRAAPTLVFVNRDGMIAGYGLELSDEMYWGIGGNRGIGDTPM
jgi:hypothetical protein